MFLLTSIAELTANVTNFTALLKYAHGASNELFGYLLIMSVWIVVFMTTKVWQTGYSFAVANFLSLIVATFMVLLQILDSGVAIFLLIATIISAFLFK